MKLGFLDYLAENFGEDHDFSNLTPYHSYKTDDGHKIEVHVFNRLGGKSAVFYNKNLGVITKVSHWGLNSQEPSKQELQQIGHDEEEETQENKLHEKFSPEGEPLGINASGKIVEHSTALHLHHMMHQAAGTINSPEHLKAVKYHQDQIAKEATGANKKQVGLRIEHGKLAARAILEHIRQKHGEDAKITRVGHTANEGDIGKFTNGLHNDTQENPSDVAVEISHSQHALEPDEKHFEGYSLKSSKKSSTITAKSPAIDMHGAIDHPRRKLNTNAISRQGLSKVHELLGVGHLKASQRSKILDDYRKKEKTGKYAVDRANPETKSSSIELATNELARPSKTAVAKELHDHLDFLTKQKDGHKIIGKMLKSHLTAQTGMPWSKVHVKGDSVDKIHAGVTAGSESPLNKIFNNQKSQYVVTRNGDRVSIHHKEKNGTLTTLAHYSPKPKSNPFKEDVHGWNVLPAKIH